TDRTSKRPTSSNTTTLAPAAKSQRVCPTTQLGSASTSRVIAPATASAASTVCVAAGGTYVTVIVSALYEPGGSLPGLSGRTGANENVSGPMPLLPSVMNGPAPAASRSVYRVSSPTRRRCCMSLDSGWTPKCADVGSRSANTVLEITSVIARAINVSTREKPAPAERPGSPAGQPRGGGL